MNKNIIKLGQSLLSMRNGSVSNFLSSCNFIKGYSSEVALATPKKDENLVLNDTLQNCTSVQEVFNATRHTYSNLDTRNVVHILNHIVWLKKRTKESPEMITKSPEFVTLCEIMKKKIRVINPNDAVQALKLLKDLNVPENTVIMQYLLQIIKHSINRLDTKPIVNLMNVLSRFDRTPAIHAIQSALPIMLQNDIKFGRIPDDMQTLILMLDTLTLSKPMNKGYVEIIMKKILLTKALFDERQAKQVLNIMSRLKYVSELKKIIIRKAYTPLCKKSDNMNLPETLQILSTMNTAQKRTGYHAYDEIYTEKCAIAVVNDGLSFVEATQVLQKLVLLNHISITLLNYTGEKLLEEKEHGTIDYYFLMSYIEALAQANRKVERWSEIMEIFESQDFKDYINSSKLPLVNFAKDLAVLDYYNHDLLKHVFENPSSSLTASEKNPILLNAFTRVFHPEYPGPYLSEDIIVKYLEKGDDSLPLDLVNKCLSEAVGGEQFRLTQVKTKLGHHIDFVVALKNRQFCDLTDAVKNIADGQMIFFEDLSLPSDSKVILLKLIPLKDVSNNTGSILGTWKKMIASLEKHTNCEIVNIPWVQWRINEKKNIATQFFLEKIYGILENNNSFDKR